MAAGPRRRARARSCSGRSIRVIVAFSVAPSVSSSSDSVHDAVAAAVRIVRASGLPNRTSSMFTEIEGEWDEVMAVVKAATLAVAEHGTRVSLVLKADYRPGHTGELDGKVQRLEQALAATEAEGTA
nr:thiamine-binding protein [Microcella frigidaquae]